LPPARTHFCERRGPRVVALLDAEEDVLELVHPGVANSSVESPAGISDDDGTNAVALAREESRGRISLFPYL